MEDAIGLLGEEWNNYYQDNPRQATKIWDKDSFDFERLAGGLFRKM